jgi:hypothetical protein
MHACHARMGTRRRMSCTDVRPDRVVWACAGGCSPSLLESIDSLDELGGLPGAAPPQHTIVRPSLRPDGPHMLNADSQPLELQTQWTTTGYTNADSRKAYTAGRWGERGRSTAGAQCNASRSVALACKGPLNARLATGVGLPFFLSSFLPIFLSFFLSFNASLHARQRTHACRRGRCSARPRRRSRWSW